MSFLWLWSGTASQLITFLSVSALLLLVRVIVTRRNPRAPLPPGPKTSWFGRVDLPKAYQWRTYASWKQTYGEILPYVLYILAYHTSVVQR